MRYILGIDHGKKGYLCLYDMKADTIETVKMPLRDCKATLRALHAKEDAAKKDYDIPALAALFDYVVAKTGGDVVVVMEETMMQTNVGGVGGQKRTGNAASFGDLFRSRGIIEALAALRGLPLYSIFPTSWKARLKLHGQGKPGAVRLAKELRPRATFKTADEAEAFLIAYAFQHHYAKGVLG